MKQLRLSCSMVAVTENKKAIITIKMTAMTRRITPPVLLVFTFYSVCPENLAFLNRFGSKN